MVEEAAGGVVVLQGKEAVAALEHVPARARGRARSGRADFVFARGGEGIAIVELRSDGVGAALVDLAQRLNEHSDLRRESVSRIVADLMPDERTLTRGVLRQVERNTEILAGLGREFGMLTSAGVAEVAGSTSTNTSATASRWLRDGSVFAVTVDSGRLFPAFQFDLERGRPRPVVRDVLAQLSPDNSAWGIALWFASVNSRLGGRRPVDLLVEDPGRVVAAAAAERADLGA
ncbi:hypothetical protein GCM10027062_20610 [Nocardioides hungaricus]